MSIDAIGTNVPVELAELTTLGRTFNDALPTCSSSRNVTAARSLRING